MLDMLALPFAALSIGAFLDISELAVCEQAKLFSRYSFECLWDVAGSRWLEGMALWSNAVNQFVENGLRGKELISAMTCYRRAFHTPPKRWRPWIVQTAFHSVRATPHPSNLHERQCDGTAGMHPAKPVRAGIAVTVGTERGQPLVVGMKFSATGPVDDKFCIGVEAAGGPGHRMCPLMTISFAPFSGICFVEHDEITMQTQALPSVPGVSEGCAWIHVTERGGVRFLRQLDGGELEDTRLLPPEMLHEGIQSYFASVDIWFSDLEAVLDVSVQHSSCSFPANKRASIKNVVEIDTPWALLGDA